MSGRKKFDETTALDAATRQFWQYGFANTSISNLESATGLNKSSLYNCFKNKDQLFQLCLDHFEQHYVSRVLRALVEPDFRTALEQLFELAIDTFNDPEFPTGCLATRTALDNIDPNSPVFGLIQAQATRVESAIYARCKQALTDAQIPENTDCKAMAATIHAMLRGVLVLSCANGSTDAAHSAYRFFIQSILAHNRAG